MPDQSEPAVKTYPLLVDVPGDPVLLCHGMAFVQAHRNA